MWVNVGMIMLNDQGVVMYKYSQEKLDRAKKLFSEEGFKLIKSFLSSIDKKLAKKDELIYNHEDFSPAYITYLSNYSNNLVGFTKPQAIDIDLTKDNFNKLFEKYIFKVPKAFKEIEAIAPIFMVKDSFIPKVQDRVNIDVNLKAEKFDFVMFNLHIDMMGKNDRPVLNQFIDFGSTPQKIQKDITNYLSIVKPLEIQDGKSGKFFLVGDEPGKNLPKQHLVWNHLLDSTLVREDILEVVPSNEIDRVGAYLENHDVKPYFPEDHLK